MATQTVIHSLEDVVGDNSISGSWGAILRATGVDVRAFPQVMDGSGTAVVQKDGHQWTLKPWEGGGGYAVASRQKTEAEIEHERQRLLRNTFAGHFSKDRLLMCASIAAKVRGLCVEMRPDHPPSRAARRSLQGKLKRLAQIQTELLFDPAAVPSLYEQELNQFHA